MSFTVTVTEKRIVKKICGNEWKEIGTEEILRDESLPQEVKCSRTRISPKYGYTPRIEKEVEEECEIFKQTVEVLNVGQIASVVNKL